MSPDPALLAVMTLLAVATAIVAFTVSRLSRRERENAAFDEAVTQALDLAGTPDDAAGIETVRRDGRDAWHIHQRRGGTS